MKETVVGPSHSLQLSTMRPYQLAALATAFFSGVGMFIHPPPPGFVTVLMRWHSRMCSRPARLRLQVPATPLQPWVRRRLSKILGRRGIQPGQLPPTQSPAPHPVLSMPILQCLAVDQCPHRARGRRGKGCREARIRPPPRAPFHQGPRKGGHPGLLRLRATHVGIGDGGRGG